MYNNITEERARLKRVFREREGKKEANDDEDDDDEENEAWF